MTVPKWLIPALAVVAALAVGIAAVLIGVRFAPTTVDEAQPNIISVPVLSPIDDPSVEPGAELDGGGTSVSGTVGEASVVAPGGGDAYALTPEDEDYLAALGASDDPGSTFPPLSEPAPDGTPAGDPCALPGAAASDCPAGVTAVVLELPLPEFQVRAGSASESSCEGSFATSPTQIRFDIRTNAPASMDIDVSQAGEATRTVHLETSEAERLRWQADFTANTAIGSWIFTAACGTFTDLVPDVPFALHIVATDDLGRVATFDRSFTTVSGRTRPPTEIYPVGNSLIWASVPHTATQRAALTAFRSVDGAEPTCEQLDGGLVPVTSLATRDVEPAVLASRNFQPEFTRSTTQTFAVPEASTIIVCARLYPLSGGDVPAWQSSRVFQSPDVAAPVATIDLVRLTQSIGANSLTIVGSTETGTTCGSWTGPELDGLGTLSARGATVCDFGTLIGRRNADGSLVVTTRVQTDHGVAERGALLPVSLISCPGGCAGAPDRYFDLPISNAVRPTSVCGSGPGCDDDPAGVVGYLRVKVSWSGGASSGNSGWERGAGSEGAYRAPSPELPTILNLDDTFVFGTGGGGGEDRQGAHLTLAIDRPVTFVAWLEGDCFTTDSARELSGTELSATVRLDFEEICRGTSYAAHLLLTDAAGVTSVWGTEATEQRWWNSRFTTDGYTYPLGIGVIVTHDSPTVTSIQVDRMDVGIGYETSTISVRAARPTNCFPVASEIVDELVTGSYSRTVRIQITGSYVGRVEATPGPEGSNRCTTATLELARGSINVEFSATLEQLEAGYTYTAYDPDTGYTVQVRLAKKG